MNLSKIWLTIKAHKVISAIVMGAILISAFIGIKKVIAVNSPTEYLLGTVSTSSLVATVEGTGEVSAKNQLNILPEGNGQIVKVLAHQGDKLRAGQAIAIIDEKNANVSLAQARAALHSAEANYNKLINGATGSTLNQGQVSVQSSLNNLIIAEQSAFTQSDNLIRTDLDKFFNSPTGFSPQFQITFYDSNTNSIIKLSPADQNQTLNLNSERVVIQQVLNTWRSDVAASSSLDISIKTIRTLQYLNQLKTFVNNISEAVNAVYLSQTKYQTNLDVIKTDVAAARVSIDNLINNIQTNQQAIASARANYSLTTAPAREEDVAILKANLESAQASYQAAANAYNNNIIKAPFAGQLAVLNSKLGDVVNGTTVVGILVTPQKLAEITLNEVDVAKITVGNPATLSLDAIPDTVASGTIVEIDSVGSSNQGVVSYKVKISIDNSDTRILSGMSVSASIVTLSKSNVLVVPKTAIKTTNAGLHYVEKFSGQNKAGNISTKSKPAEVNISTGFSNDTETEIISGLSSGEVIVFKVIPKK